MTLHPDRSPLLHHFIKPEYLIALLEKRAFHLLRQDKQSDVNDGKLPDACFENPYIGPFERAIGANEAFLKNRAVGIEYNRHRRFIMSWTLDPSEKMRMKYGENGKRCEIQSSILNLRRLLGYTCIDGAVFPPKCRPCPEILQAKVRVELNEPVYTDGNTPIPVLVSTLASAHKDADKYEYENEIRIQAFIMPPSIQIGPNDILVSWPIATFEGLVIQVGPLISREKRDKITLLASDYGIRIN